MMTPCSRPETAHESSVIHHNSGPGVLHYEDLPDPVCADDGIVRPCPSKAAIQLAHRAGATVIATASSSDKLERLKAFGAGIAGRGGSALNAFSLWARNNTLHGVLFPHRAAGRIPACARARGGLPDAGCQR